MKLLYNFVKLWTPCVVKYNNKFIYIHKCVSNNLTDIKLIK